MQRVCVKVCVVQPRPGYSVQGLGIWAWDPKRTAGGVPASSNPSHPKGAWDPLCYKIKVRNSTLNFLSTEFSLRLNSLLNISPWGGCRLYQVHSYARRLSAVLTVGTPVSAIRDTRIPETLLAATLHTPTLHNHAQ